MTKYWFVSWNGKSIGCVQGDTEPLAKMAATLEKGAAPTECFEIPHPFAPRIGPRDDEPDVCRTPRACGRVGYCPRRKACYDYLR